MSMYPYLSYASGEGDCEASIQHIRPDLKRVRNCMSTYYQHKMQFARRRLSLRTISEQYGVRAENNAFLDMMDPDNDESQQSGSFYANFYRYTTVDAIKQRLNDGWPICGFTNKQATNSVFIVYGNSRSEINYVRLDFDKTVKALICGGMNYFSVEMDMNLPRPFVKQQFNIMCDGYCLLLPYILIDRTGTFSIDKRIAFAKKFTLLTDTWEVIANEYKVQLSNSPQVSETLFKKFLSPAI